MSGGFRGFSELSARADEFTAVPDGITRVYVLENEITYLAFPVPAAGMVIFGGGYAVAPDRHGTSGPRVRRLPAAAL